MEVGIWREVFREVKECHDRYDARIVRNYLRQQNLANHDMRFNFTAGDKVLLHHCVPGKLNLKVQDPTSLSGTRGSCR